MNDFLGQVPAPVMSDGAFYRRREHLLAELERPSRRRLRPAALVLVAAVLGLLAFAPIGGASLAHRVATGLGGLWSTPAPPPKDPAEVQSFVDDWNTGPWGLENPAGVPLLGEARDLASGLGTAGDTITAFPTSDGAVCYMVMGAGSCGFLDSRDPVGAGITFGILSTRITGTTRLFGVASDEVASVNVVIDGIEHPAILRNNAFYYQLPQGISERDVEGVVATWTDGSTHTFPVSTHPAPPGG